MKATKIDVVNFRISKANIALEEAQITDESRLQRFSRL